MTRTDMQDVVNKAAENGSFKFLARLSMILISTIVIPLGTYIGSHSLATIDDVQRQMTMMASDVRVLTSKVDSASADRYRSDEARRDFQLRDTRIDTLKDRVDKLDRIIDEMRLTRQK